MTNTISELQGKTVYRNSSYAPTRGTNSPTGYIQREMAKRGIQPTTGNVGTSGGISTVGGDGQSDTRSGLASNALNSTSVGTGTELNSGATGALVTQNSPTAQISAIGEINLPYNFSSNQNLIAQKQAAQQSLLELNQQRQQQNLQYLNDVEDTNNDFNTSKGQITRGASGRGLLFGTAHGKTARDNYDSFSNMMSRLASNEKAAGDNYTDQQNQIIQNLNDQIVAEAQRQGYEASQNAGKWTVTKKADPKPVAAAATKATYKPAAKPKPKSSKKKKK